MGAICCLEKAELPLHQGSSQIDGRKGQTFFRGVKERGDRTSQDRRSAKREFLQAKIQKCFERPAYLYKKSARDGISEIEEVSSEIEEAIPKSKIPKSVNCLSLVSTHHTQLSFAKMTGSLSKHRFQPSVSLSLVSTCHMQSLPSTKLRTRSVNSGY
ncbi:hypothetical protein ACFX1X_003246 [Malus domestica]